MAESPATALRRYQTDLRKLVRGGVNRYADAKKCWVVWTDDARNALTDAANGAIVGDVGASNPLPERLSSIPGLERALRARRRESSAGQLRELKAVHAAGRAAVFDAIGQCERVVGEARTRVQAWSNPSQGAADDPLFGSLRAGDMIDLLSAAIRMIRHDCEAKAALLEETIRALEESDPALAALRAKVATSRDDGNDDGSDGEERLALSREALTTIVATWILSPYVNKEVLAEIDAVAALEMRD